MKLTDENDLVGGIYDAALGLRSWEDIGNRLVTHMGALTLMFVVHDPTAQNVDVVTTLGLTPKALKEYGEYYAQHDLWVLAALEKRQFDQALLGSQVVEERLLENSLFYHDFLRPLDMYHLAGAMLKTADGNHAVIGLQRPRGSPAYHQTDSQRLTRLLPHLRRAMEIRQRLKQAEGGRHAVLAALDHLSLGVILIGRTGKIVHVNAAADAILNLQDGLARAPGGLRAASRGDDVRLQELLTDVQQTALSRLPFRSAGGHVRVRRLSGRRPYTIMIAPIGTAMMSGAKDTPTVLIFIADPGSLPSDPSILRNLFGFSPAEAELVLALISGATLPEIARGRQLSYNTVRTLLSRAMARTDTHSQVDLVRLTMSALGSIASRYSST